MKRAKQIIIFSGVVSLVLSVVCFAKALMYEIDAYDFGYIYSYINPAKVFFVTALILLVMVFALPKIKEKDIKIEDLFTVFFIVIAVGFSLAYISSNIGNRALDEKSYNYGEEGSFSELAHADNKIYLPFYDEYSDESAPKGNYELYKSNLKSTVMIYVCSNIIGKDFDMQYELEFLHTKNILIYIKYMLQRLYIYKDSVIDSGTQNKYSTNYGEMTVYKYGSSYMGILFDGKEFLFATLDNAKTIEEQDFADACAEQYFLMKKTLEKGRLLDGEEDPVLLLDQSGDGSVIDG